MNDFFTIFSTPSAPPPPQSPGPLDAPDADTNELARMRANIERGRRGRSSFVREPGTFVPAGSSGINTGRPVL